MLYTKITRNLIFAMIVATLLFIVGLPSTSAVVEYGLGMVSETIPGRNSTGPYFLAYTLIQENTLEISVNGVLLRNGKDYNVDVTKGILTFNRILISDAVAKVTYKITPDKSVKTAGLLSVPLEMDVLDTGSNKLKLIGGYTKAAANSYDGDTVVGLGTDSRVGSGNVSTLLLTGKAADSSPTPAGTSWNDKSLYKVAAQSSAGGLNVSGNILRAGKSFVGAKQYGVTAGRESEDVNMVYKYGKLADFSAVYQNVQETAAGTKSTIQKENLTVRPGETTTVAITHGQNITGTAAVEQTVDTTGVKVDQKIGQLGNAVASREEVVTTNGSSSDKVATTHVAVSGGTKTVQVSGSVDQKDFTNKQGESNLNLSATAKATENVGVNMGYAQAQNDSVGNQTSTIVNVNASNGGKVSVQAAHQEVDSTKLGNTTQTTVGVKTDKVGVGIGLATAQNDNVGDQTTKNVNLAVQEGSILQVNAAASQSDSTKLGAATQHSVSVKSNPTNKVQISGSLTGSESTSEIKSQKEFSIVSKPVDYAQLTAAYTIKSLNDNDDITKVGTLELAPLTNAKFAVGWKSIESGGCVTTITDYSTTATPVAFLTFNGKLRQRVLSTGNLDTHVLDVKMAAAGSLSLEGNYRFNPEDDKGAVQTQRSTGVGLRSNLGRLGLYGGFNQKDEYVIGKCAEERKFTLDYKLDDFSSFSAGLLQTRLKDGSETGNDTYNMGFQRKVGSGFDLLLSGKYVKYLQDSAVNNDDVRAEASLSMGF